MPMPSIGKTKRPCHSARLRVCVLGALSFAGTFSSLSAQTDSTPDTSPPPLEAAPTPTTPAPAAPPETSSAVTVVSDSSLSPNTSTLSSAAGPTPSSGPGAPDSSDLGDRLGSPSTMGRLPFRITATLGESYNNNIFAQRHQQFDYITRLSVTGEYQIGNLQAVDGNYFDMIYTPTLHLYARHGHENGVDQDVDVLYAHHFSKLTLSLEQIYTSIQSTDAAIGGLVTADVYSTIAKADFVYSDKVEIIATVKQIFTSYDQAQYTDTKKWAGDIYGLYQWDPKLSFGIGPRFGYLTVDRSADETYEQLLARAIYVANDKLTVQAAVGGEDRQYIDSKRSDSINPIFELSAIYLPFPSTNITLNSFRRFTPSYNFIGQDYIATNVNLTATQRFFHAYYLGVTAGYENDDYEFVTGQQSGPTREDNFFYVMPSLTWKPNGWFSVRAFDKYEKDHSNFTFFGYDANQLGVSCSATY